MLYGYTYKFKSSLLKKIFSESNLGWVDIEKAYFDLLKSEIGSKNNRIDKLNEELKTLKQLLKDYLKKLDFTKSKEPEIADKYISQFIKGVNFTDLIDFTNHNEDITTNHLYFLNFNYTPSLTNILNDSRLSELGGYMGEIRTSQIHGNLETDSYPLIFGYGDEMDKDYSNYKLTVERKEIVELNTDLIPIENNRIPDPEGSMLKELKN